MPATQRLVDNQSWAVRLKLKSEYESLGDQKQNSNKQLFAYKLAISTSKVMMHFIYVYM